MKFILTDIKKISADSISGLYDQQQLLIVPKSPKSVITTSPSAPGISRIMSPTSGTTMRPDRGFLMLIIGVVISAFTSDLSNARSQSIISQLMSFKPLQ